MSNQNAHVKETNGSDDIFANSSNETVVDNIDFSAVLQEADEYLKLNRSFKSNLNLFPTVFLQRQTNLNLDFPDYDGTEKHSQQEPIVPDPLNLSFAASKIVAETCVVMKHVYCPFCPLYFRFESLLKEHLKTCHSKELTVLMHSDASILLHPCPLCNAKFYVKLLLPKHILHTHQQAVLIMLQESNIAKFISCKFCSYKVLHKHKNLLLHHVEKKHCAEFESFVESKYSNKFCVSAVECENGSISVISSMDLQTSPSHFSSGESVGNNISSESKMPLKPILKSNTKVQVSIFENNVRRHKTEERSSSVRRKLRFTDGDTNIESKTHEIKNSKGSHQMQFFKFSWKSIFRRKKSKRFGKGIKVITSTPIPSSKESKPNKKQLNDFYWDDINSCSPAKRARMCMISSNSSDESTIKTVHGSNFNLQNSDINQERFSFIKQFVCAICMAAYTNNNELLKHIRKEHKGPFNILKPHYRCGECEAKFFKNSFLIRHCKFHHTPLCLKKK